MRRTTWRRVAETFLQVLAGATIAAAYSNPTTVHRVQGRLTPTIDGRSTHTSDTLKHTSHCLGRIWRHILLFGPVWFGYPNVVVRISTILSYAK